MLESGQQARSSVVEHHLDMVVVGGSIPLAPTISATTTSSGNAGPVPATFFRITILLSRITT